jgi:hypothetical protein
MYKSMFITKQFHWLTCGGYVSDIGYKQHKYNVIQILYYYK